MAALGLALHSIPLETVHTVNEAQCLDAQTRAPSEVCILGPGGCQTHRALSHIRIRRTHRGLKGCASAVVVSGF